MDLRKNKKQWLREAIINGGTATDICYSLQCRYRKERDPFICGDCAQAVRRFPGWPTEEYFNEPVHGTGSA